MLKLAHKPENEAILFKKMLEGFTKPVKGVEIGALNGLSARMILNCNENISLTSVDPIVPDSMEATLIGSEEEILENNKDFAGRFKFIKDYSYNVVNRFKNESLDFIFVDGSHIYDDVIKDIEDYEPKVKKGGLLFFHDSLMFRGGAGFHIGSSKAVEERMFNNPNFECLGTAFSLSCFKKL